MKYPFDVNRLTPAIGGQLSGLDVKSFCAAGAEGELSDHLYNALMENHVLFIRDAHLGADELAAFARSFGPSPDPHHSYVTHDDHPDVVILEWGGDKKPDAAEWHSDMTYRAESPFATVVQAEVLPPSGGDTLWANMGAVLDSIDPGLRRDLEQIEAVHDMGAFRTPAYREDGIPGIERAMIGAGTAVHPVVSHHPVTGRPYLNVSESFTRWIIGFSAPESARLLTMLFDVTNRPEFHVRLRWETGTVAIWDNRGTQHYAVADYLPHRRVLHRVGVSTDRRHTSVPVS